MLSLFKFAFMGSLFYAICQWMIISVINRMLGLESVGIYAAALGIVVVINALFNFGARQIAYTSEKTHDSMKISLVFLQVGGLLVSCFLTFIFDENLIWLSLFLYLFKMVESLSECHFGVLQRTDRHIDITRIKVVKSFFYTISFCFLLYKTGSLEYATFAMLIANLVVVLFVDKNSLSIKPDLINKYSVKTLIVGFPLGLTALLLAARSTAPRYILENTMGYKEVGVLVSYLYIVNAAGMIVQAISQVISPKLSRAYNDADFYLVKELERKGLKFIILYSLSCFVFLITVGDFSFKLLYGRDFYTSNSMLISISIYLLITFVASYYGYLLTAVKAFKSQTVVFSFLLLLSVLACYYSSLLGGVEYVIYSLCGVLLLQIFMVYYLYRLRRFEIK